ncbi:GNAT family N-acetyltransferase [Pararhodobacter zhoushanensis]|uniref:GNAT family N-acetyltransferase n=1 Tax=Pararhodobacter zhoushanensis TaxID=2479545 RepID=UPI000F8EDC1C|nr:GNAT family N-acetyltransferase [Pararhodobacter zhoushanensis]
MRMVEIGFMDPAEADQLGTVFFDAVRQGAAGFYDADQRRAWAPRVPAGPDWARRLTGQQTLVARVAGKPVGFMTLDAQGYIDLAFVAPAHQRQGVGGRLYARIEDLAQEAGLERLHAQASHLVRGLFEQQGWRVLREQQSERAGVTLTNFVMEKRLSGAA